MKPGKRGAKLVFLVVLFTLATVFAQSFTDLINSMLGARNFTRNYMKREKEVVQADREKIRKLRGELKKIRKEARGQTGPDMVRLDNFLASAGSILSDIEAKDDDAMGLLESKEAELENLDDLIEETGDVMEDLEED